LDVSEASLRTDLARTITAQAADRRAATPSPAAALKTAIGRGGGTGMGDGRVTSPSVNSGGLPTAGPTWLKEERMLLHLWFQRRISTAELTGRIGPDEMSHPAAQALMRLIVESADWEAEDPVSAVSARASVNETLAAAVAELSLLELEYDSVPKAVEECLYHLNRRRLEQRIRQLEEDRRAAEKDGDHPRVQALQAAILESRRSLGAGPSGERARERTAPVGLG